MTTLGAWAQPAIAATPAGPPNVPAPTTTTLPPLPQVPPAYTDGQSPQDLLSKAISLSSLGHDNTALLTAVSATQAKLDAFAQAAARAQAAADAAGRLASAANAQAEHAGAAYSNMAEAARQAAIQVYVAGPGGLRVSPTSGSRALYAEDYIYSTYSPYGILAQRRAVQQQRDGALGKARHQAAIQSAAAARAAKALAAKQVELDQLKAELASVSSASLAAVAADHVSLASQAGQELLSQSALQFAPKQALPAPVSTTSVALTWGFAELGKQYVWGATGPDTFDCSGLTQFVWKAAGVSIPRVASDQDAWTIPVPLSQLLPGDLVFFGSTDIHHVGIYIGDGLMINAPHTGTVVQVDSIWWSDLAGFGRVHYPGTPVPPHDTPSPAQPVKPSVVPTAGPVPSQTAPPPGWKPKPGSTTPIVVGQPTATNSTTSSTSSTTSTMPTTSTTSVPPPPDPNTTVPSPTTTTSSSTTAPSGTVTPTASATTTVPAA